MALISCTGASWWSPNNWIQDRPWDFEIIQRSNIGHKFGYIDRNGKLVIDARYDEVFPFKDGHARVRVGEFIGFIDRNGKYIQQPECNKYDREFKDYYLCTIDRQTFVRDWNGKTIVAEPLSWIREGENGFAALRGGSQRFTYFNIQGKEIFQADEIGNWDGGIAPFKDGGKWGYIRSDGSVLLEAEFHRADPFQKGQGYVARQCQYYSVSTEGELQKDLPRPRDSIMDCGARGNVQSCTGRIENQQPVECQKIQNSDPVSFLCKQNEASFRVENVEWVSAFQYGLAHAKEASTGKIGVLNLQGKWLISPRFNRMGYFDGCYAYAEIDHRPYAMDQKGNLQPINENPQENLEGFPVGEGVRCYEKMDSGKRYYCHTRDYTPHPQRYEDVDVYSDGLMAVRVDYNKAGFVDPTGKLVVTPRYQDTDRFSHGMAGVRVTIPGHINQMEGYIDRRGRWTIEPRFSSVYPFQEGLARVRDDSTNDWFFIDTTGKRAFSGSFEKAQGFSEGLAGVSAGNSWGFKDENGNVLFGRKYDYGYYMSEGMVSFCDKGRCGYLNRKGDVMIPPRFCVTNEFHEGLAAAAERCTSTEYGRVTGIWGYIDTRGNYVLSPSREYTGNRFLDGHTVVKKNSLYGLMDRQGRLIVAHGYTEMQPISRDETGGVQLYLVSKKGLHGFMRNDGSLLSEKMYSQVRGFEQRRALILTQDLTWSIIDETGRILRKTDYTFTDFFGDMFPCDRLLVGFVKPEDRQKLLNRLDGAGLKERFGVIREFEILYGFLDRDGNVAIPAQFNDASPFSLRRRDECTASVSKGMRFFKIDVDGNVVKDGSY